MIIDETFMWLYWFYKAGAACENLCALFAVTLTLAMLGWGISFGIGHLDNDENALKISEFIRPKIFSLLLALVLTLLVNGIAPRKDELKAYAAYRIGERVVTSEAADRMMNAALLYLEGKASEVNSD